MRFCLAIVALIWLALSLRAEDGKAIRGGADNGRRVASGGTAGEVSQIVTKQAGKFASGFFGELRADLSIRPADDYPGVFEPCGAEKTLQEMISDEKVGF